MFASIKNKMIDTSLQQGLRKKLIQELREKGIQDERVLLAFWNTPRHWFIDREFDTWAYKDTAFKIDAQQTISQPYTVAKMTELLEIRNGDKILEIGTGSGFQACILSSMGAKVYTIERHEVLYKKTSKLLNEIGFKSIRTLHGDGYEGAPRFASFDKIIVTAGASTFPKKLFEQLNFGGIMIIPLGEEENQTMVKITKLSENRYSKEEHGVFSFVPFLEGKV